MVEFQVERAGLRSMQRNTSEDVFEAVGDLWRYLTHDWLTYRTPTADQTRARWPMAPEWQDIQAASLMQRQVGLTRLREGARSGGWRPMGWCRSTSA